MEIHRKLSNGGYAFTNKEVALVMIIGLPKSYESLILNLEKDEVNLTTTIVKSRLLIEEKIILKIQLLLKIMKNVHFIRKPSTRRYLCNQTPRRGDKRRKMKQV